MKNFWRILTVILILGSTITVNAEKSVILANIEFPPYSSQNLLNGGFSSELITVAFHTQGYKTIYKWVPWARGLKKAKTGEYDGLCQGWHRKDREKWFIFSSPYAASEVVFFKRKKTKIDFNGDYSRLRSFRIGTVRGYANPPEFDVLKDQLQIDEVTKDSLNLKKLYNRRLDLVLIDRYVALSILGSELQSFKDGLVQVKPSLQIDPLHIMFSRKVKNVREIADAFAKGMQTIEINGRKSEILKKHGY